MKKQSFIYSQFLQDKKVIVFDLDGTLTKSKKNLDAAMAGLLCQLLDKKVVAVIGGAAFGQFQNQFLSFLKCQSETFKILFLFPTSGASFYRWEDKGWQKVYEEKLTANEKNKIEKAFQRALEEILYKHPSKVYGEIMEDRGSQITFSALGQEAPLKAKKQWSKTSDRRQEIKKALEHFLPEFEVRLGGLTSIDVTRRGIDKAYGIRQIVKYLKVRKDDLLFVGDALYEGGNDFPVKKEGVETVTVTGPAETKKLVKFILKGFSSVRTKKTKAIILTRSLKNPIIAPNKANGWEAWQTFNPGVVLLDDKVHFLYRAIGEDGVSRLGYAVSSDGLTIDERLPHPAYEHKTKEKVFTVFSYLSGGSWGGAEDPRLVRVENEDILYMTYTACDGGLCVGLTAIKVDDFLNKKWRWKPPVLISPPGEVHKNWLIFPEKINGQYAIIHSLKPDIQIEYVDSLDFDGNTYIKSSCHGGPRKGCWDKWVRGAGAPPIKTKYGWLLFYHAMDNDWSKYKVGAMLLDLHDPTKILRRAKEPVLEPEEFYENSGVKPGIVYVSGAVVKDESLLVYYGGADNYVCVAHANLNKFLAALIKDGRPKLKLKTLKTK